MGDLIDITINRNEKESPLYKLSSKGIQFPVKAFSGAAIGLTEKPGEHCDVLITFENNQKAEIWCQNGNGASCPTTNIICGLGYARFWLSWGNGSIQLGRHKKQTPLLYLINNYDLNYIKFYGINQFHGYPEKLYAVYYRLELPPTLRSPDIKKITGGELQWVHYTVGSNNSLPDDSLIGGYENDNLYVIRIHQDDCVIPGKFVPSQEMAYSGEGSRRSYKKNEFEVLCGFNCTWVPSFEDNIPADAIIAGYSAYSMEKLYIGRALCNGHMITGNVKPSKKSCVVCYKGGVYHMSNYEILVSTDPNINTNIPGTDEEESILSLGMFGDDE